MNVTWHGIYPAATTQFNADQSLNLKATTDNVEKMMAAGMHGMIMLGSVGENTTLEYAEKLDVLKATVAQVKRRIPVLTGVAETTTKLACRFAEDAKKIGVDGLMVLPAMIYKSDPRETMTHFRSVARATDLPILVYNNPPAYGVDITPEMFADLADEKTLAVAIKESSDNRSPHHRHQEPLRRPLHPLQRRGRPGPGECHARQRRLGVGPGQCVPGGVAASVGHGDRGQLCGGAEDLPLVHAAVAPRHAREAGAIHQAGRVRMRLRHGDDAGAALAAGGKRARGRAGDHSEGETDGPRLALACDLVEARDAGQTKTGITSRSKSSPNYRSRPTRSTGHPRLRCQRGHGAEVGLDRSARSFIGHRRSTRF